MSHFHLLSRVFALAVLLAAFALPGRTQTLAPPPAVETAAPHPNLADGLAAATPPTEGILLAVDAAKVKLPKDAALPGVRLSVAETASLYGRLARTYGDVTAIAPSAMTVVYAPPDTPNPYDGMPPDQVLRLLTSSFNVKQWKAFMGPAGIGLMDLTSDSQKQLFMAFFPDGHIKFMRPAATGYDPNSKQDISGDTLKQAHIKIAYSLMIGLQLTSSPSDHIYAGNYEPPDAPAIYYMLNSQSEEVAHEFGANVRETLPNTPKPSDLRPNSLTEKTQVPLDGIKTVNDLIAHIAAATHLELYADARYGKRIVTLLGPAKTASASDLLQALSLCVHGTYRQVGPAYVLTDDLLGAGTKHMLWKEFESKAQAMLPSSGEAPQSNPAGYTTRDIGWSGDPEALSAQQISSYYAKEGNPFDNSGMLQLHFPFDQLTPVQQDAARHIMAQDKNEKIEATLDGTIELQAECMLQVTLPSVDGVVEILTECSGILPDAPRAPRPGRSEPSPIAPMLPRAIPANKPVTLAAIKAAVAQFPHRAVRIALKSDDDISPTFAAMQKLGFNEAWVDIPAGVDAKGDSALAALIAKAVQVGKKDNIAVYPDIRLLDWGKDAPADLLDRDIVNRTATDGAKVQLFPGPPTYDTVTPFAPEVIKRLAALVSLISRVKGIDGMIWDDPLPAGYEPYGGAGSDSSEADPLGYAPDGRLANLRQYHADPVDLYTNNYTDERANVQIPGFNDDFIEERALYENWRRLRALTAQGLSHWLIAALPQTFLAAAPDRLPLIVRPATAFLPQPYISWDNLMQPRPTETFDFPKDSDGQPIQGSSGVMRISSKRQYAEIGAAGAPESNSPKEWAAAAARMLVWLAPTPSQQGIVLNADSALQGFVELGK